jgi:hypothetical protein
MARFVEKLKVHVRAKCAGAEPVSGYLSLAPQAAMHEGPETLLELLNSNQRMFPLLGDEERDMTLIARAQLEWVEAGADVTQSWIWPQPFLVTRDERVAIEWPDGRKLEGRVPMELPRDLNRASDFMNGEEDFFPLISGNRTLLVSKLQLRGVLVFSASPKPQLRAVDPAA